jgi:hypothetical protein
VITYHIPTGSVLPDIEKELSSARNIKDKSVRNNTIDGLHKIKQYL